MNNLVMVECSQDGIRVPKYGLLFNGKPVMVDRVVAERLVKSNKLFSIVDLKKNKKNSKEED